MVRGRLVSGPPAKTRTIARRARRALDESMRTLTLAGLVLAMSAWSAVSPSVRWGDAGHRLISRTAAEHLPTEMPAFMRTAVDRLAYLGPEPDRWRRDSEYTLKNAQEPDHYINLERLPEAFDFPRGRYEFYASLERLRERVVTYGGDPDELSPDQMGLQPWISIEVYDRLKVAFREYRALRAEGLPTDLVEGNAILYAGWLGHYVADGAQPQHTTIHYDGWIGPNPNGYDDGRGSHHRFESSFIERNIASLDPVPGMRPPRRLTDPFDDYLAFLWASHARVEELYRIDRDRGFDANASAGSHEEALAFTRGRLVAGSQMLVDLWFTAWLESEPESEG